jgi:threonine dehydrogenase-like Zn-dependent dehydrogenase
LGHEVNGQVIEAGSGVKDINLGDRVTLQRYLPCCSIKEIDPECNPCQEGNYPLCENFSKGKMPSNLGAGFSDHFIAHRSQLLKVPDEITNEQAVMLEPTSVSLHAVLKHPPKEGEKVLVIGAGSIGLNVIQIAKIVNPRCSVYVLERFELKKELSYKFGADYVLEGDIYKAVSEVTGGNLYMAPLKNNHILGGFDLIYDCVASSNTIHDSMRWLKAKGTYVMIGAQLKPATFDHTPIFHQELTIVGVNSHGNEKYLGKKISSFELAMEMILERKINLERFISHRFSLNKYREAFMLVKENPEKVVKVVFEIE